MLLVDTNVIIDALEDDPKWYEWSVGQMRHHSNVHELVINPVIYAELAPTQESAQILDSSLEIMKVSFQEIPRQALFLAGVAHRHYRQAGGPRESILADFLIGAHAAVLGCGILTRDARRYRKYFPLVPLLTPA